MPITGDTIAAQVGAAMGLWTHTPVDWRGNETGVPPFPAGWPTDAFVAVPPNGSPGNASVSMPTISGVSVSGISAIGATVNYTLSQAATKWIEYGTTAAYGSSTTHLSGNGAQSDPLTGLVTGTVYHYRVGAQTAGGSITYTNDATFTTS